MNQKKLKIKQGFQERKDTNFPFRYPKPEAEFDNSQKKKIGRCVGRFGKTVNIVALDESLYPIEPPIRCHLRSNLRHVVVGDLVKFSSNGGANIVSEIENRTNTLERTNLKGENKTLAANIDQIMVVTTPENEKACQFLDRYLVTSELIGIKALIVINKKDLLLNNYSLGKIVAELSQRYTSIGYQVIHDVTPSINTKFYGLNSQDRVAGYSEAD